MAFLGEAGCLPYDFTIKSLDAEFGFIPIGGTHYKFEGISNEEVLEEWWNLLFNDGTWEKLSQYLIEPDYENGEMFFVGTIRCHAGSTAEAYAIEHGMDYELTHFYEGEWNYDWDNLIRWRKCIHCDERETELLETEQSGDTEIIAPADDDTSFDVDPVTESSTEFVLIQEVLGEMNIVKAFDISLKNNDGVHVQPKGTVKVKLPNDFQSKSYKVYRVNDDGTYTDMNAFREGSHLVFFTDHFSLYVIVDESTQAEPDNPDAPDGPSQPDTSEKASIVHMILQLVFDLLKNLIAVFAK